MNRTDVKSLILIFLLLLLTFFMLVARKGARDQASFMPNQLVKKIDQSLKDTNIKNEINQLEVDNENEIGSPLDVDGSWSPAQNSNLVGPENLNPLSFEQENPGQQVLKDIQYDSNRQRHLTPEQRVNSKLEREMWVRDYENSEREVVVKQFIENAKKEGVQIKLNKNLDVTGVTPVQNEEPILFRESTTEDKSGE